MEVEKVLSIITINYNGLKDTCELIESLPADDESLEVIVVDNASTQDEASEIENRFPHVMVIRSDENLGFAGGNNLGIQAAHGKYLFFLNNDTLLEVRGKRLEVRDLILPLINRLENDDKMKIIDTLSATTKANQKWAEGKKKQMNSDR